MFVHPAVAARQRSNDFPYYRPIWRKVVLILLAVSFAPLFVIGGGVSFYAFSRLEHLTLESLRAHVLTYQQEIDRFLDEREKDLRLIASLYSPSELVEPGRLAHVFHAMRQQTPGFLDLGVLDMQGKHLAYVGPYPLMPHNYAGEPWFQEIAEKESYISDVYLGFRNVPHFIMAVRQGHGPEALIIRATVDSDHFDALVGAGPAPLKAEAYIVNSQGLYQTRSQSAGPLLSSSGLALRPDRNKVEMTARGNDLLFTVWQKKVPWLNVVQVKRNDVFFGLNQVRLLVIITFLAGGVIVAGTVIWTTGKLIALLEAKGQSLRVLDKQLRRTSYLSSSMELSMGFLEEVKDILANIDVSVKWLSARGGSDPQERSDTLDQITREASRGHALIRRFTQFVQASEPVVTDVQANELLDDLLSFLHKELERRNIRVVREYQEPLQTIRSDRGKLRQIFQHLLLNAMAALDRGGQIRLTTRSDADRLSVIVSDDGPGIAPGDRDRIFEPLYTTKPQGTGLGLTMCLDLLEQLGGRIAVDAAPGQGAAFTVELPCRIGARC